MGNYYTVGEVAYLYGVSEQLVLRWIRNGELKAMRIPNAHKDEHYYSGKRIQSNNDFGYAVSPEALDRFMPNVSYRSVQLLEAKNRKSRRDEYLCYLDKREQDLYDEIEFISKMRSYIEEIEPYIYGSFLFFKEVEK